MLYRVREIEKQSLSTVLFAPQGISPLSRETLPSGVFSATFSAATAPPKALWTPSTPCAAMLCCDRDSRAIVEGPIRWRRRVQIHSDEIGDEFVKTFWDIC